MWPCAHREGNAAQGSRTRGSERQILSSAMPPKWEEEADGPPPRDHQATREHYPVSSTPRRWPLPCLVRPGGGRPRTAQLVCGGSWTHSAPSRSKPDRHRWLVALAAHKAPWTARPSRARSVWAQEAQAACARPKQAWCLLGKRSSEKAPPVAAAEGGGGLTGWPLPGRWPEAGLPSPPSLRCSKLSHVHTCFRSCYSVHFV